MDALLLVEGEANAVAVHVMDPELEVLGLPGHALTEQMAEQLGHVQLVFVWIDRHDQKPAKRPRGARREQRPGSDGRAVATACRADSEDCSHQQQACVSLGCSEEFFVEHVRPLMRVVRRGRKRLFPVDELRRVVDGMAEKVL